MIPTIKTVYTSKAITEENKIDTSIFKKRGNSKTFKGFLIQKIKDARDNENSELVFVIKAIYDKYLEFEKSEKIKLEGWKKKSTFEVIEKPDIFIIITYQREDQDSDPKEMKHEITKNEVNRVLSIIKSIGKKKIPTSEIAEKYFGIKWDKVFSDRALHLNLNLILRLLDYKRIIKYRGGYTEIL